MFGQYERQALNYRFLFHCSNYSLPYTGHAAATKAGLKRHFYNLHIGKTLKHWTEAFKLLKWYIICSKCISKFYNRTGQGALELAIESFYVVAMNAFSRWTQNSGHILLLSAMSIRLGTQITKRLRFTCYDCKSFATVKWRWILDLVMGLLVTGATLFPPKLYLLWSLVFCEIDLLRKIEYY